MLRLLLVIFYLSMLKVSYADNSLGIPPTSLGVTSGIFVNAYNTYLQFFSDDTCADLSPDFSVEQIDRLLVDVMLTCLAFEKIGVKLKLKIIPYPNNRRASAMVTKGEVDTLAASIWSSEIDINTMVFSDAAIRKGEYEKGVYVHETHPLLNMPLQEINLQQYRGITMRHWQHDLNIMRQLTPKVMTLSHVPSLFLMLSSGRADFILSAFPEKSNLTYSKDGINLKPIHGIKVVIDDSRHFIAAKNSSTGLIYIELLNKGLALLRQQGVVHKLYQDSGFINEKANGWKVLNTRN